MRWGALRTVFSIVLINALPASTYVSSGWTTERKMIAREASRELWQHGFNAYMEHAFPLDELKPLSCRGQGPDWFDPRAIHFNDVNANVSITLIDNLDTFVVLGNRTGFTRAVQDVMDHVTFDVDTKPQVFEITIRAMGGLLSGHLFASHEKYGFAIDGYRGELLELALDLGRRLLPAFETPTGIPYARVNLRRGVQTGESYETCAAGAGSLLLEFATLSRWTGDTRFESAASKAFFAVWSRRSVLGLVGNGINLNTGAWIDQYSGIGAGIDSFFEYALKMYVLTGENQYLDVWNEAYGPLMKHSRGKDGFWYRTVQMHTGQLAVSHIDSLGAFWPGLQVLAGDIEGAIKSHLAYWNLWKRFSGIPETFNVLTRQAISLGYPLRPEFIESTYFLYRATRDSFYLDIGQRILEDITRRSRVPCGLSTMSNLLTSTREDRMESFALSESLKYLFLLFDEKNPLNSDSSSFVFTTEGHLLSLQSGQIARHSPPSNQQYNVSYSLLPFPSNPLVSSTESIRQIRNVHKCPVYAAPRVALDFEWRTEDNEPAPFFGGLVGSVLDRSDFEYARLLAGIGISPDAALGMGFPSARETQVRLPPNSRASDSFGVEGSNPVPGVSTLAVVTEEDRKNWSPYGWCDKPTADEYILEWLLSANGGFIIEDTSPSANKVAVVSGGLMIYNVSGIRVQVLARVDRTGYDIIQVGPYRVSTGQKVWVDDPVAVPRDSKTPSSSRMKSNVRQRAETPDVYLRFSRAPPVSPSGPQDFPPPREPDDGEQDATRHADLYMTASTATFGGNPALPRVRAAAASPSTPGELENHSTPSTETKNPLTIPLAPLLFGPESPYNGAVRVVLPEPSNIEGCDDHHPWLRFGHTPPPHLLFSSTGSDTEATTQNVAPATASILFIRRGGCAFLRKLYAAKEAGFAGVIVWNAPLDGGSSNSVVNPSVDESERPFADRELGDVSMVVIGREDGAKLDSMMQATLTAGTRVPEIVVVEVSLEPHDRSPKDEYGEHHESSEADAFDRTTQASPRILWINGLPLKNTILV